MISVVIPALNEGGAIRRTIEEVRAALSATPHEIIVVEDGGNDNTGEQAAAAGATVIRHPHNLGYGASLKTGIRAAQHDTIVITDADGTYPNGDMPKLLAEYRRGFNMVVGARSGDHYRESVVKAPLRVLLKWLVEFTTGRRIPDVNSGLRVFSRAEALPLLDNLSNTFSFTTSITLAYMMTAKFVGYVSISYHSRVGRTKVRLFRDSLRTLQFIVQAILQYNPLKLFILVCGGQAVIGVLALLVWWLSYSPVAFAIAVGSLLSIIPVFCLGLVADLLSRVLAKGR